MAHPCQSGDRVSGVIENGNALGFSIRGDNRRFSLSGILLRDPALASQSLEKGTLTRLYAIAENPDRYGRHEAQVFSNDVWVQGRVLQAGAGLFDGTGLRTPCIGQMEMAESAAAKDKMGVWQSDFAIMGVEKTDILLSRLGKFSIVEGRVLSVGDRKDRVYLNFGQKWSQDTTVLARRKGRDKYNGEWGDLLAAKGKQIRVRGMIEKSGGPMIRIFHEAQISFEK